MPELSQTMQTIDTPRLKIIVLPLPMLQKLIAGTPQLEKELGLAPSGLELDMHTRDAMTYLAGLAQKTPDAYPWITNYQIIWQERNLAVGSSCFMSKPDADGQIEIGYGIYPKFQNRAFMTEALQAICAWAFGQPGGPRAILAETEPDNPASRRVLQKCGFQAESPSRYILHANPKQSALIGSVKILSAKKRIPKR